MKIFNKIPFVFLCLWMSSIMAADEQSAVKNTASKSQDGEASTYLLIETILRESTNIKADSAEANELWHREKIGLLSRVESLKSRAEFLKRKIEMLRKEAEKKSADYADAQRRVDSLENAEKTFDSIVKSAMQKLVSDVNAKKILDKTNFMPNDFDNFGTMEKFMQFVDAVKILYRADKEIQRNGGEISSGIFMRVSGKDSNGVSILEKKSEGGASK